MFNNCQIVYCSGLYPVPLFLSYIPLPYHSLPVFSLPFCLCLSVFPLSLPFCLYLFQPTSLSTYISLTPLILLSLSNHYLSNWQYAVVWRQWNYFHPLLLLKRLLLIVLVQSPNNVIYYACLSCCSLESALNRITESFWILFKVIIYSLLNHLLSNDDF